MQQNDEEENAPQADPGEEQIEAPNAGNEEKAPDANSESSEYVVPPDYDEILRDARFMAFDLTFKKKQGDDPDGDGSKEPAKPPPRRDRTIPEVQEEFQEVTVDNAYLLRDGFWCQEEY